MVTLGGKPGQSSAVDGIGSAARFNQASGIAVDSTGDIYIANINENCIVKGTLVVTFDSGNGASISNGNFNIRLTSASGSDVVVEASSDLTSWSPIATNSVPPDGSHLSFPLSGPKSYYRAHAVP